MWLLPKHTRANVGQLRLGGGWQFWYGFFRFGAERVKKVLGNIIVILFQKKLDLFFLAIACILMRNDSKSLLHVAFSVYGLYERCHALFLQPTFLSFAYTKYF